MAILPLILTFFIPLASADTAEERALQLNEEMDFLMSNAAKPRIWNQTSLPPRTERSGPAPTQMEGIENLENRFFEDEVRFQAAQAAKPENIDNAKTDRALDPDDDGYRVDGTIPNAQ